MGNIGNGIWVWGRRIWGRGIQERENIGNMGREGNMGMGERNMGMREKNMRMGERNMGMGERNMGKGNMVVGKWNIGMETCGWKGNMGMG